MPPAGTGSRGVLFPPDLARVLRALEAAHDFSIPLGDRQLTDLLTDAFFASTRREEQEHHSLRIAVLPAEFELQAVPWKLEDSWRLVRFERPVSCNARHLLRLARAAPSERLFIAVSSLSGRLVITGLARETGDGTVPTLKLVAPEPGCLEVWLGPRRVLEYAHGRVVTPPENVLLAPGSVRSMLLRFAAPLLAPDDYVESVRALVRGMAAHRYGGILILSSRGRSSLDGDVGFVLESDLSISALQEALLEVGRNPNPAHRSLLIESLRAELALTIAEVGRLTALDGATILDWRLSVLGFGAILPVVTDVAVMEASDAAATSTIAFPLQQYGARHRAAASYASEHPESLVFIASSDGDMACMLRKQSDPHVLMWRFRSGDLTGAND